MQKRQFTHLNFGVQPSKTVATPPPTVARPVHYSASQFAHSLFYSDTKWRTNWDLHMIGQKGSCLKNGHAVVFLAVACLSSFLCPFVSQHQPSGSDLYFVIAFLLVSRRPVRVKKYLPVQTKSSSIKHSGCQNLKLMDGCSLTKGYFSFATILSTIQATSPLLSGFQDCG